MKFGLLDIELKDKLTVIGYFRQYVDNLDIPKGIINYVIIFLFFVQDDELYIGNLHKLADDVTHNNHIGPCLCQHRKHHDHPQFIHITIRIKIFLHQNIGFSVGGAKDINAFRSEHKKYKYHN